MAGTTKSQRKSNRDIAYYTQRYRNRVFARLVSFVSDQLERNGMNKKDIAEILGRDPAQITRWLSQPSNMNLDTVALFALAFDAEPEPPEFIRFADRRAPNYIHPLIARATNLKPSTPRLEAFPSGSVQTATVANSIDLRPRIAVAAGSP